MELATAQTRPTDTINARTAFHEVQAALRPLLNEVQTQEQLDAVLENVREIRYGSILLVLYFSDSFSSHELRDGMTVHGPTPLNPKGRPRTQRITGAIEGRPRGGGASGSRRIPSPSIDVLEPRQPAMAKRVLRCGMCRCPGHNRLACPLLAR
ncbi:hypothetical protein PLEOSDRAFT_1039490 [Pleurotus ostreatus PC15]|uniref:Uncharacterized protein n=1 Tax=Pleurotus ostreatus (strain PC15) TaxID=1137138 RepID=A0A067NPE0_PLEO1|nr:hypothetical protein PLEOSDRAFT_1039490 [Pleurotus ostreatus PC15]